MVRAILDGTKTQTRRIMKPQMVFGLIAGQFNGWYMPTSKTGGVIWPNGKDRILSMCPYGHPGEHLWVRETWAMFQDSIPHYKATGQAPKDGKWRPSIHMPRWASRITLEITGVRVERLQDISEADAIAEGVGFLRHVPDVDETLTAKQLYECLWESINGPGSWESNPWVWVVSFKQPSARLSRPSHSTRCAS